MSGKAVFATALMFKEDVDPRCSKTCAWLRVGFVVALPTENLLCHISFKAVVHTHASAKQA
jgi:hypothetical protein